MSLGRTLARRAGGADLALVDGALALVLGAVVLVNEVVVGRMGWLYVFAGLASAATVAWRRRYPAAAAAGACMCIAVMLHWYGDTTLDVPVVIVLDAYALGRRSAERRGRSVDLAVFAASLPAFALVPGAGDMANFASDWGFFVALPFVTGLVVSNRTSRVSELQSHARRLEGEQGERARRAALDERARIARELHDVVAHNVSVMVIQAGAAQRVAADRPEDAREALCAVASSGRDALNEMRRMVGLLRRGDLAPACGPGGPSLSQLDVLVERARAAGLRADLRVDGVVRELPADLDLVAFRVLQEAITNVIKHAGPTAVHVQVTYRPTALDLEVSDDGAGPPAGRRRPGAVGRGLVGMQERLAPYGGQLQTGRHDSGGFRVKASVPLPAAEHVTQRRVGVLKGPLTAKRWFDPALAASLVTVCEIELAVTHARDWAEAAVVAAILVPLAWRRRYPLATASVSMAMLVAPRLALTGLHHVSLPSFALSVMFISAYTVSAYEEPFPAVLGLVVCVAAPILVHASGAGTGSLAFLVAIPILSWAAGRALAARRRRAGLIRAKVDRIEVEGDGRERLAVADERSRVSRELDAFVATNVSAMVLQAEVAQGLLGPDPSRADNAMASIEEVGRETLDQMRVVLGVLRSYEDPADRAPQPGVGQIHSLVESAREDSRRVELQVEGEPALLPASVNLGVYRIIEDALSTTTPALGDIEFSLVFGESEIDLTVTASRPVTPAWPTPAMCEWVALCEGKIGVGSAVGPSERLHVRLPREREGVPS